MISFQLIVEVGLEKIYNLNEVDCQTKQET